MTEIAIDTMLDESRFAQRPLPLSERHVAAYVADRLTLRERLLAAAAVHGSPLYAVDADYLARRAAHFRAAFDAELPRPLGVYAAVKTNNCPEVARCFVAAGLGLDVSSGVELELALRAGAERIIFSGPGKTAVELALAVEHAERTTVLIDSFGELQRLAAAAEAAGREIRAGVRLTTNPTGMWRKFGITLDRLGAFLDAAAAPACRRVRLEGIQFHTSWNLDPSAQVVFMGLLGAELRQLSDSALACIKFIDVGGGYWPESGEWLQAAGTDAGAAANLLRPGSLDTRRRYHLPGSSIETFAAAIATAAAEHFYTLPGLAGDDELELRAEPGRWLCHGGMHLLMTVVDKKADDLVVTDCGMNAVGWERFESDFFPVINLTRPATAELRCDVLGCLCTPHDIWGYGCWGEAIEEGDILFIPDQGAYTYSLRQDFIKSLPAVAMLD